ncbi:hypothetical protein FA15DRAFT_707018 [Coprinopsis marcescibilis]|uniref:Uncharacterized protein n=1 Tax=Coprinopsis marcescibilis TaxID=230819 RepID=A0A5C3KN79_COPMA|nr:hypothetical protein FA15DRAFT_707018 [Coprinopsis marcescibilis]
MSGRGTTFNAQKNQDEQLYHFSSLLLGLFAYGVYLTLFALGFPAIYKRSRRSSSWVFMNGTLVIFVFTTTHTIITFYRAVIAYGHDITRPELAITYYHNTRSSWDGIIQPFLVNTVVWTADALVIHRCFIICERNYLIIFVPCLLLLLSIATGICISIFIIDSSVLDASQVAPFFSMVFPLNLAENMFTTGLICHHIYRQHQSSNAIGAHVDGISLLMIIRVVIESAAIYTVQQFVMLVLFFTKHPAQGLFHGTLLPSIGIVFLLMVVRTTPAPQRNLGSELIIIPGPGYLTGETSATQRDKMSSSQSSRVAPPRGVSLESSREAQIELTKESSKENKLGHLLA